MYDSFKKKKKTMTQNWKCYFIFVSVCQDKKDIEVGVRKTGFRKRLLLHLFLYWLEE